MNTPPPEDVAAAKEHTCSFDDLLCKQRAALRARVDSLRFSVEQFDERCRDHLVRSRQSRRRSDGDLSSQGWFATSHGLFVNRGQAADITGEDCWGTTSESDTDESVIEFCATSQKSRQTRGTQTKANMLGECPFSNTGGGLGALDQNGFPNWKVSVSDAATQTAHHEDARGSFHLISRDKIISQQLLDVFEVLAMHRPNNGMHRSLFKKTNPCSPIDKKSKQRSSCFSNAQKISKPLFSRSSSGYFNRDVPDRRHRRTNKHQMEAVELPIMSEMQYLSSKKILYSHRAYTKLDEYGCRDSTTISATSGDDGSSFDTGSVDHHAEDDLWRLAEEGRLPWTCNFILTPKTELSLDVNCAEMFPVKLLYRNETDSSFGPFRLFRRLRHQLGPTFRPPISIPPILGVILEH